MKKIGFVIILFTVGVLLVLNKTRLIKKYNVDLDKNLVRILDNQKKIEIIKNKTEKKLKYNNLKYNISDIYEEKYNNDYLIYYNNYESDTKYSSCIKIGMYEDIYNNFYNDEVTIYGDTLKKVDAKEVFKKNKINNNSDLQKAMFNDYNIKTSVFTSLNKIKHNYLVKIILNTIFPNSENETLTIINGDFDGYMVNINNKVIEVHLNNSSDEEYVISFWNNSEVAFTEENVIEFIKNVEILN